MERTPFEEVWDRHHTPVFHYFRQITLRTDLAEDLTQETFLRVVRSLPDYREQGRERAWVFRIAASVLGDSRRRAAVRPQIVPFEETVPRGRAATAPTRLLLEEALVRLIPEEREAFLLREWGGLSYQEISAATGTTSDAVRSQIYRARTALRRLLEPRREGLAARWGDPEAREESL